MWEINLTANPCHIDHLLLLTAWSMESLERREAGGVNTSILSSPFIALLRMYA